MNRPSSAPLFAEHHPGRGMCYGPSRGGRDSAGPDGVDAAHIECSDEHHRKLAKIAIEQSQHPFVTRKQARDMLRRRRVHAK